MQDDKQAEADPSEDALERAPWCLLVPDENDPSDPDIIGPFTTYEEAVAWAASYPNPTIRTMRSPEFEILAHRASRDAEASLKPRN